MGSKPVRGVACCVLRVAWREMADLSAGNRHSRISVLFPEPLTPVTRTSRPSGNRTVRSFRLFLLAPLSVSQRSISGAEASTPCPPSLCGLWTLDLGPWTPTFRLWTLDFGLWTLPTGLLLPRVGNFRFARDRKSVV